MLTTKISGLFLVTALTHASLHETKPFLSQTIQTSIKTPNQENITNTFIDNKNTIWVSTKDAIFYKLATSNAFIALKTNLSTSENAANARTFFVKTHYSDAFTFYIYKSASGMGDFNSPILKITYKKNSPLVTSYDLSSKIKNITSVWADDRGILVAGTDVASKQNSLFRTETQDLNTLQKTSQPDEKAFAKNRVITTMFRADKNSDLQNMIVVATSSLNPLADNVSFTPQDSTILSGTDLSGQTFNNTIDTIDAIGAENVYGTVVISKYTDNKTAYLMMGSANPSDTKTSMAIDIVVDEKNPQTFTFKRTWNSASQPIFNQIKSAASINNYVFFNLRPSASTNSITNDNAYSLFTPLEGFTLNTPGNAGQFDLASDKDFLNVNDKDYVSNLSKLINSSSDPFNEMPSCTSDAANLFMGVGDTLMYLGQLPHSIPGDDSSLSSGAIAGIVIGCLGLAGIAGASAWYFVKKKK